MKTFIIAAVTADGYIAKDASHTPFGWTSQADKKRFIELTRRAGAIIMGSSTYKTIGKPLKDRVNIIYSKNHTFDGVEMTEDQPRDLLKKLENRGFKEVAVCGGTSIYSMFMKAGVVDTIYLTIEPLLFGKGLPLFNEDLRYNLILKSSQVSESTGSLLLEYRVNYTGTPKFT